MTDKLIASVSKSSDDALRTQRKNAQSVLDTSNEPARQQRAEALLAAIDAELARRHLPGMIDTFLQEYPGGFYGERLVSEERNYKLEAHQMCRDFFSESEMTGLIAKKDWEELFQRTQAVVKKTNLMQPTFECSKLFNTLHEAGVPETFYPALHDCLHGQGTHAERVGRFSNTLIEIGLGKWTYASYFIFLYHPDECMFVKPEGLKQSVKITQYPMDYEATPSGALYQQILEFSHWLKDKLSDLKPRDMIDIQSFMWHMAPTGIHARDAE